MRCRIYFPLGAFLLSELVLVWVCSFQTLRNSPATLSITRAAAALCVCPDCRSSLPPPPFLLTSIWVPGPLGAVNCFSGVQHLEASTPEHSRCSCRIDGLAVVQKLASKSLSKLCFQARKYAIIHNSECLFKSWMEFHEDKKGICSLQVHPLVNLKCLRAYESTAGCFRLFSTSCYIEFVKVLLSKALKSSFH